MPKYAMTNARYISDSVTGVDIINPATGKRAGYAYIGTRITQYSAAQFDDPPPHVVASRAFAAHRATRFIKSRGLTPFIVNGILDPNKIVPLPERGRDCD